jgi:ACR3 family arsenite efflux pump ArsB
MWKLLSLLQKNLVWSIPAAMALGLLYGYLFDAAPLKQWIIPVTFVMVYPMMVTLNVKSMFKGNDAKLQIATQLINFILIPLLAFYTGKLFFDGGPEKYGLWAVGLFLIGVLPTSGMTISWTCPKPVMVVRLPDERAQSTGPQAAGKASERNGMVRKTA